MKIGTVIANIRKSRGIKQHELAKWCDMSKTALSMIEQNINRPNSGNMQKICKALKVSEPLVYFCAIEPSDVPEHKRDIFELLYPSLTELISKII